VKISLDFELTCVEDGPEMTHITHGIVKKLIADSILRQLDSISIEDKLKEQGYRSALIELLELHKQVIL
jgi:hypothetical protein